jgi:predicted nuclease with TOPRIM domain
MNNEEYVHAQIVMGSTTTLAVQALTEANDELQSEVDFLKEENARLRNHNRVVTAMRRQISGKALDLMKQVEEMGQHIFDIAANEVAEEDICSEPSL